jgi:uncharacterized membrane protein YkoI
MTMRRKLTLLLATVVGAGLVASGVALAQRTPDEDEPAERRTQEAFTRANEDKLEVTQAEAEAIARRAHAGSVVSIHLEDDGSGLEWEIEVDDGSALWELNVNAQTGRVLDSEADDQGNRSDDQDEGGRSDDKDEASDDKDDAVDD